MTFVKAKPGEDIDSLLRRFKKAVDNEGVLASYRRNEYHEKPSEKRKRKEAAAAKKRAKYNAKQERKKKNSKNSWKWNYNKTKKIPMVPRRKPVDRGFNNKPFAESGKQFRKGKGNGRY